MAALSIYLLFNVGEVTLCSPTNLQKKKKKKKKNPDLSIHSLNTWDNFLSMTSVLMIFFQRA